MLRRHDVCRKPFLRLDQARKPIAGLILLLLASLSAGEAQAQGLVWAKRAGGSGGVTLGHSVALDSGGNSYVTGLFYGSSTFGPGEVNQTILTSATPSVADIFVAKYNSAGALQWAHRAGASGADWGWGIAADASGNSYVTGRFEGSVTFATGKTVTSAGGVDIFIAKYNSAGTVLWVKRAGAAGTTASDEGQSIAVDSAGNPHVAGYFQSAATFGAGELNQTVLTSAGSQDVFLAKFSSATGDLTWAKRAGGASVDQAFGVAVDASGNAYVTGAFQTAATFGLGEANVTNLTGGGAEDVFVAKFDSAGALAWAKRSGGAGADRGEGIGVDAAGNSYITGHFENFATFGPGEGGATSLTSAGSSDIFVAKFGSTGTLTWAKRAGGLEIDQGLSIAVDTAGSSYLTGSFRGNCQFGVGTPSATTLNTAGNEDFFVAKYDNAGLLAWAKRSGGVEVDLGHGIAVKGSPNNIHVTGYFQGASTFGPGEGNQTTLTATGFYEAAVAKYMDSPGSVNTSTRIGTFNAGNWRLDSNGNGAPDDPIFSFNTAGATRITGDWNGDGRDEIGLFVNGFWFLDFDGNGVYDGGVVDKAYQFGWAGVQPYVGDWNGDGRDKIGIFINGFWFFDFDGNGVWGGPGVDRQAEFGWSAVTPFVGDWNGDGRDKIGIYINGFWYFDYNGNYLWDGPVTDRQAEFGFNGVTPFIGDWNGDGRDKIGIFINGFWFLDFDGNNLWDGPGQDTQAEFGFNGVTPIIGDWNGGGSDKIGIFINGIFYLDFDGSATWDGGVADKGYVYGQTTDIPTIGVW